MQLTETVEIIMVGDNPRIILVKFTLNPVNYVRKVLKVKLFMHHRQCTMDKG